MDALIHIAKDLFDRDHFSEYKLAYWILASQIAAGDSDLLENVHFEHVVPQLADRSQLCAPFFLVKSELRGTDRLQGLELCDRPGTVEALDTAVDIAWKAEKSRLVGFRQGEDETGKVSGVLALWCRQDIGESLLALEGLILEQLIHVGSEHPQIEIVVYTPTINRILEKAVDLWPLWLFALALLQNVG